MSSTFPLWPRKLGLGAKNLLPSPFPDPQLSRLTSSLDFLWGSGTTPWALLCWDGLHVASLCPLPHSSSILNRKGAWEQATPFFPTSSAMPSLVRFWKQGSLSSPILTPLPAPWPQAHPLFLPVFLSLDQAAWQTVVCGPHGPAL